MEKRTIEYLRVTQQDSDRVTGLSIPTQPPEAFHSFYEDFTLRGIRVDRFQPGFVSCSFTVPPRLTDRNGNMAVGAIANLVDEIGATMVYEKDVPMNVSIDMSISYLSTAKLNDELEISAKLLGGKGAFNGTLVLLKNKATGEVIAEGRHSLFVKQKAKFENLILGSGRREAFCFKELLVGVCCISVYKIKDASFTSGAKMIESYSNKTLRTALRNISSQAQQR